MLLQDTLAGEKTSILVENYARLLNSGVDSSKILVVLQNSNKKAQFIEKTLEKLTVGVIEKLEIYSFFGLVYNTISDNWAKIENLIPDTKNTKILPNLTGLEVSQYIMRQVISEIKFEGYNSKKSLLHQLFRRYSLIVQNNLSDEDVKWRSEDVLKESFAPDAKRAIDEFKRKTLEARALDYLRQSLIFNHIYKNTDYFKNIEYLIVDDGDEITPICFDFIQYLKPQLKDVFIAYDSEGSSRSGYLSADKTAGAKFEALFGEPLTLPSQSTFRLRGQGEGFNLYQASFLTVSKRAQMLDSGILQVKKLLAEGANPSEICVVTPIVDDMLRFCLKEGLKNVNVRFLSGSEKIIQNPIVLAVLNILKVSEETVRQELTEFDIRSVLEFLQIPLRHCKEILENFEKHKKFINYRFVVEEYSQRYSKFLEVFESLKSIEKLSEKVYEIYENLVEVQNYSADEITKFNFFIKQIEDFESVLGDISNDEIISQIENSIISENPYSVLEISESDLVVATPQKIIDNQILTKYQIWFDVSSGEWVKSDTGPLYNAWVFQADWDKDEYTLEDNIELSSQKTQRILRKLSLCAKEKIYAYASLFDGSGVENFGGIEKYFTSANDEAVNPAIPSKPFIPRDDQRPVLGYKKGSMAISAVPGAGKTTILLALIIKLLKDGVKPENIFVLTYMESAARNFRERIQNANQQSSQLPNISTIHGLALKILKENSNYERLGLNADFEICDDTQRSRILREVGAKWEIKKQELEDFDKAVSIFKIGGGVRVQNRPQVPDKKLSKFLEFFEDYKMVLQENNLIDYDDMLLFSVKLLEENPDILKYYQELCEYIIEDEAQDSSAVQQRLIELLSSKHKNLIRCGDINQAITTTFSNADVEGFRRFIETGQTSVSMDRSQRCTKDVWNFANSLITYAEARSETKNAFYKIFMKPVEGKNPESSNAISPMIFENEFVEKNFILKQIKNYIAKNPKATIGILLRSNFQVASWIKFINNAGMKTITRSECLEQKGIFRTIFSILKIIQNPFDNENLADNYDTLAELGHYKSNLYQVIKNHPTPFLEMSADDIENPDLAMFYWDMIYWLSFAALLPEELAIKIGLYYYASDIEKSNVYLVSTLIKRISMTYKKYPELMERLAELAKKPNLSGFKFFSEEDEPDREFLAGKVQIMTLHKSKGDEFDLVFLPEMAEKNLPLSIENISLKKNARFMESVRELNPDYETKTDEELKEFLLAENLRLFYVAVTRAKRKLYITANKSLKYNKTPEPSVIFERLL